MEILVSGSLAYDRIMDFPGLFSEHIMPDKIDNINVSFTVNGLVENFGGTAGNIAFALSQLGESPRIISSIGHDYHRYFRWLDEHSLVQDNIRVIQEEPTASAYITTDQHDNQITGFNPGAMKYSAEVDFSGLGPDRCIAIIAPGNLDDMANLSKEYKLRDIFTIFDPGQSLPVWDAEKLSECIQRSQILISNDYEHSLICEKTGISSDDLLKLVDTVIVTQGANGCLISTKENCVRVPAIYTNNAIDPTGAGDAFRGGLLKGLAAGHTVQTGAQMGTLCANLTVQQLGTQNYKVTKEFVEEGLKCQFGTDISVR